MDWLIDANKKDTKLPLIIRAAVKLFVQQGIEATTTKQISQSAGVAEGTLYRHFKGKDEMAKSIFTTHLEEFTKELQKIIKNKKTTKEKLRGVVQSYFEFFEKERILFEYIVISEYQQIRKYTETKRHPGHLVLEIIEQGIKAGELPEQNATLSSALIVGMIHRVSVYRLYDRINENLKTHVASVTDSCWQVLTSNREGVKK